MTELPEDVALELERLFRIEEVPPNAVTLLQMCDKYGGSTNTWSKRMKILIAEGTWRRGKRTGDQAHWYWPMKDE